MKRLELPKLKTDINDYTKCLMQFVSKAKPQSGLMGVCGGIKNGCLVSLNNVGQNVLARSLKIGVSHTYGRGVSQTYGRGVSHTCFGVFFSW